MRSCLYEAEVVHDRRTARRNLFRYGVYLWLIDLDELDRLDRSLRLLGVDRAGVHSVRSEDHLGDPACSIRENVDAFLASRGVDPAGGRVQLLTSARVFGHVFNPLSVFYFRDSAGSLSHVVAEVHNTHGERHCYLLEPDPDGRCETDKRFFVSPFLEVRGRYRMTFQPPGERLAVRIDLEQDGRRVFAAALDGRRVELSDAALARMLVRHPLVTWQVSALIRRQGLRLWSRRTGRFAHPRPAGQGPAR